MKKAIVIGLDGFEPKIAEAMMAAGELPNLARLKQQGGYSRLKTTTSAQTPVAWSTFSTGTNPGGHGIFDFLSRDPKTYLPVLALSRYEQKNAFALPKVINQRRGTPFWDILTKAGLSSTVLRCPCTYPPDPVRGRLLSGVGVPDIRGGLGTSTFYTSADERRQEHSEKVVRVTVNGDGVVATSLIGLRNPKTGGDFTAEVTIHLRPEDHKVVLRSGGPPAELEIREGEWSDWLKVKFKIGMLQSIRGTVRFYLRQIQPVFEFYASQVNFDPEAPLFPISFPPEYAKELEARQGTYATIGMAEDHDGLINGRIDEYAFLDQCALVMGERRAMMLSELERLQEGFFFCLFDTPDRLQHMMWRFREPEHPANANGFNADLVRSIEEHYRACDQVVGEAYQYADDQTLFIVLSDHGMNSFRRGLNLNTWLYEQGFLALKPGFKPGEENGDFFHNVDWGRTQAYALGLGTVFLNMKGREEKGVVAPEEASAVKSAIVKSLTGLCDPEKGEVAVRSVVTREQVYSGPYL
ncbi:MAG TPA: alkaline phosphatase family protein, partial [Anaerolineales bacterium]